MLRTYAIAVNGVCIVLSSAAMLSYATVSSALLLPTAPIYLSLQLDLYLR